MCPQPFLNPDFILIGYLLVKVSISGPRGSILQTSFRTRDEPPDRSRRSCAEVRRLHDGHNRKSQSHVGIGHLLIVSCPATSSPSAGSLLVLPRSCSCIHWPWKVRILFSVGQELVNFNIWAVVVTQWYRARLVTNRLCFCFPLGKGIFLILSSVMYP